MVVLTKSNTLDETVNNILGYYYEEEEEDISKSLCFNKLTNLESIQSDIQKSNNLIFITSFNFKKIMAIGTESIFIQVIISLALLLFTEKIFAELFHRVKLLIVLGELLA